MGHVIKYENKKGEITKDGHTMFPDDIAKELNRKESLEHQMKPQACVNEGCIFHNPQRSQCCSRTTGVYYCKKFSF